MNRAILSLGSNIGDREKNLSEAIAQLISTADCVVTRQSSIYETEPWGNKNQPTFYNQVIEIETAADAQALMLLILEIEKRMGRIRTEKWEPRIIDIDILFFNNDIIHTKNLTVPHPHIQEREFVLIPLKEILPDFVHPGIKKTVSQLMEELKTTSAVTPIN